MELRNRFHGIDSAILRSSLAGRYENPISTKFLAPIKEDRARICRLLKKPRNLFPAWRAGTTTLFVVPARQATQAGWIDSLESISGLYKRLQIRALV